MMIEGEYIIIHVEIEFRHFPKHNCISISSPNLGSINISLANAILVIISDRLECTFYRFKVLRGIRLQNLFSSDMC